MYHIAPFYYVTFKIDSIQDNQEKFIVLPYSEQNILNSLALEKRRMFQVKIYLKEPNEQTKSYNKYIIYLYYGHKKISRRVRK